MISTSAARLRQCWLRGHQQVGVQRRIYRGNAVKQGLRQFDRREFPRRDQTRCFVDGEFMQRSGGGGSVVWRHVLSFVARPDVQSLWHGVGAVETLGAPASLHNSSPDVKAHYMGIWSRIGILPPRF